MARRPSGRGTLGVSSPEPKSEGAYTILEIRWIGERFIGNAAILMLTECRHLGGLCGPFNATA